MVDVWVSDTFSKDRRGARSGVIGPEWACFEGKAAHVRTHIDLCTAHVLQNVWRNAPKQESLLEKAEHASAGDTQNCLASMAKIWMDGTVHHVVCR